MKMRQGGEIPDELLAANQEAILSPEERKMLLDRRFTFYGNAERVVWGEQERIARLAFKAERGDL
jgi:hypothetical protein